MLHTETVAPGTLALIQKLMSDPVLNAFFLASGTALSLQIGHRKSEDIDLFNTAPFNADQLATYMERHYKTDVIHVFKNGIFGFIGDVKVDIISYQYPLIQSLKVEKGIRMAGLKEIGAMKLSAIADKGTRLKDFVDIHALLEHCSLEQLLSGYERKYATNTNRARAIRALTYTKDIKTAPVHFIGTPVTRPEMEQRIKAALANPQKIFASKGPRKRKPPPGNNRQRPRR